MSTTQSLLLQICGSQRSDWSQSLSLSHEQIGVPSHSPLASQASSAVQSLPSLQAVPALAPVAVQSVARSQPSTVQGSSSSQTAGFFVCLQPVS